MVICDKTVDNEHTYGLAMIDFHYPKQHIKILKGPDGIYFRFNRIKCDDMKKAIIVMFVVTVILTIAALIDEFMIQDAKHGQSRFYVTSSYENQYI